MDLDRLTQKSQEALHDAQTKAVRFGHVEVDGEHLLLALLDQPDELVPRLLSRWTGIPISRLTEGERDKLLRVGRPRAAGYAMTTHPWLPSAPAS
jgi:ATP-dependent Clp protease ATP-binding subunit ClpB